MLSGQARGLPLRDIAGYIGPDFPEVQIVLHIPKISRIYHNAWNHPQIPIFYFQRFVNAYKICLESEFTQWVMAIKSKSSITYCK